MNERKFQKEGTDEGQKYSFEIEQSGPDVISEGTDFETCGITIQRYDFGGPGPFDGEVIVMKTEFGDPFIYVIVEGSSYPIVWGHRGNEKDFSWIPGVTEEEKKEVIEWLLKQ